MRECPNCGKQARDEWTLCPSCGIDLRKAATALGRDYYVPPESGSVVTKGAEAIPQGPPIIPQSVSVITYHSNALLILFLVAVISAAVIWQPLGYILIILSAIAVYGDAKNIHAGNGQEETFSSLTWSPFSWSLTVLLVWLIAFPLYLYKRRQIWEQSISSRRP